MRLLIFITRGHGSTDDVFKFAVFRKLKCKLLHLATLNDLSRLRSPGNTRGVLVGECTSPTGVGNRIIAIII